MFVGRVEIVRVSPCEIRQPTVNARLNVWLVRHYLDRLVRLTAVPDMPFSARVLAAAIRKTEKPDAANLAVIVTGWVLVQPTIEVAALDAVPGKRVYENGQLVAVCERVMAIGRGSIRG